MPQVVEHKLVRRLNPLGPKTVLLDEATGEYRVKPGSLYLRRNERGLSVYELSVLHANGLSEFDACRDHYNAVAMLDTRIIEDDGSDSKWVSDPWPSGADSAFVADVAHALIFPPSGLSNTKVKLFFFNLAASFGYVTAADMEALRAALRTALTS